jgi:ATP-dependent helicase HrpB
MTRLDTVTVTRDAADQRRGRAGRTGPGVCYRLWSLVEERGLVERRTPEVREADLAPLALELAAWGIDDPAVLRWLDPPAPAPFAQARELLHALGCLDAGGGLTAHGREVAALPAHPRVAHMLVRSRAIAALPLACDIAALLSERDPLKGEAVDPDFALRLDLVERARAGHVPAAFAGAAVDRAVLHRVLAESRTLRRRLGAPEREPADASSAGVLIAFAFPDRIARRRGARGRFLLHSGRGASIDPHHSLAGEEFIVAAELAGHGRESAVWRAAALPAADLHAHFGDQIAVSREVDWDVASRSVRARCVERLGAIELRDSVLADPDLEAVRAALLAGIRSAGLAALPWPATALDIRRRIAFLRVHEPEAWPDAGDAALAASLDEWLAPWLAGRRSWADLETLDWAAVLAALLGRERTVRLGVAAPTHYTVPSGSSIAIDYSDPVAPSLSVRLQEVFGLLDTPRIAGGRVPLTLKLLSPAYRPVQVTRDLASFWRTGYFEVRKDLRARYPKHAWPEDPLHAEPTRGARRRR